MTPPPAAINTHLQRELAQLRRIQRAGAIFGRRGPGSGAAPRAPHRGMSAHRVTVQLAAGGDRCGRTCVDVVEDLAAARGAFVAMAGELLQLQPRAGLSLSADVHLNLQYPLNVLKDNYDHSCH